MLRNTQSGFSLIEMIVVLVIIGMLAGLVIGNVGARADKAKWDAAKGQVATIQQQIEAYRLDVGRLPGNISDLIEKPGDAEFWTGPYIKKSLRKDPWGREWIYREQSDNGEYELLTYAKDGSNGGDGTNKDISVWD